MPAAHANRQRWLDSRGALPSGGEGGRPVGRPPRVPEMEWWMDYLNRLIRDAEASTEDADRTEAQTQTTIYGADQEFFEPCASEHWGLVLEGQMIVTINGATQTVARGERYQVPWGAHLVGFIHAGCALLRVWAAAVDPPPAASSPVRPESKSAVA